ncbi:TonB-dependent receptor [Helicobacter muridarum]|uniref:Putative ferric enterobactin uptake receptor n=1 Tax=Helicobacter muridarum TaxID=216 RepID=A0A099U0E5_9HELI|nr:TonB-dependent receptor [Helicobacter muridarum]TLE00212.1 TonB-dependent receptor [Helicobacter muridarum]STQ85696.1 putative ferric enterobactin uptake receptor [Helicobacter muridarum]
MTLVVGGDLGVTAGVYYYWERLQVAANKVDRNMHQFAIFAEGQWFLTDQFSTTLGLRYNYANLYSTIPNPRFYLNYNPTSWLTLKGGIAGGMQIPGLNESFDGVDISVGRSTVYAFGNPKLKAEKSWNTEFSAIFDTDPVYVVGTVFFTYFLDQIQSISVTGGQNVFVPIVNQNCPDSATCTVFNNVDKSFMAGVEFSLQTKSYYGFSLDASYGFIWTEQLSGSLKGEPVNSIPRHKLVGKVNYKWENLHAYLRLTGNYQTPTLANAGNARSNVRNIVGYFYKDYTLVDLAVSYKLFKLYMLTFAINNLLNLNFIDFSKFTNNNTTTYQNNYQRFLPGRNYWFSLKVDF